MVLFFHFYQELYSSHLSNLSDLGLKVDDSDE